MTVDIPGTWKPIKDFDFERYVAGPLMWILNNKYRQYKTNNLNSLAFFK